MTAIFGKYLEVTKDVDPIKCSGKVIKIQGLLIESEGPAAIIGEVCRIESRRSGISVYAEVVGLRDRIVQLMAYEEIGGLEIGCRVIATGKLLEVAVSNKLLGRVLDAMGKPIDGKGEIESPVHYPAIAVPPNPLSRRRITERISTGIRAIDGLLSAGRGQRLGIFAGSGVGKSTLLGMIARNTNADINVVALIGERGREVNDFIENDLGPEGLARSVLVITPSNSPPLSRLRGAYVATAVAEYFRDQGLDVMLLFDSVTRFARAQREIGLATGEPPATRGYTPSMFDSMPKLLERSGTSNRGSITAFYTVLVDADELDEPVSDTVRGILDGHIVLSRNIAEHYHYPAIDVLGSISRLDRAVAGPATMKAAGYIRNLMAVYAETEDLINVGAYQAGSNPEIDEAVAKHKSIEDFLIQAVDEKTTLADTLKMMGEIAGVEIPETETAEYLRKAFGAFNFSGGSITVPEYFPEDGMSESETPQNEEASEALYQTRQDEEPLTEETPEIRDEIPAPETEELPFEAFQNETGELPLIDL